MDTYYLDSSSLIKRYVVETGSAWVKDLSDLSAGNILLTSRTERLSRPEAPSPVAAA